MPKIEWLLALALLPAVRTSAAPPAIPVPLAEAPVTNAGLPARWNTLPPARQREVRARYKAWRALPESERQRQRDAAAGLAALPVVEQQALRARFAGLDRLYRDGWRLGPQLGAFYPALQPLLGYLPETQREPMLALLRQLDARQLGQLSRLSQRTPPQEREALRTELLALPAAGRAQWLQRRSEE